MSGLSELRARVRTPLVVRRLLPAPLSLSGRGMGALGLFVQATAQPVAHLVEPFIESAGKVLLAALGLVGEASELARHFGKAEFEFARAPHRLEAFHVPVLLAAPGQHRGHDQKKESEACAGKQDLAEVESLAADLEDGLVEGHPAILRDSGK